MNKTIIDAFAVQANLVSQEVLDYAQRPNDERDEENEGQMRRLRAITGALNATLMAVPPFFVMPATPEVPAAPPPPPP